MSLSRFRSRGALASALLASFLALPGRSAAVPPSEPPDGSDGRSGFVPHAGYLRTNKLLRLRRSIGSLAAPGVSSILSGTRKVPVVLLSFNNTESPLSFVATDYRDLLFGCSPAGESVKQTMTQYYRDVSYGRFKVTGDVFGWHGLPKDDTYYENGGNGAGEPFGELLEFGLRKLDAEADLGQYDNDGPDGVPNSGDDDGKVDTVFFIHPEAGAECNQAVLDSNIWSHSWHYSEPTYGRGGVFESNDVRRAKAPLGMPPGTGPARLKSDGSQEHIVVDDYTIQPGLSCKSSEDSQRIIEIGVFCHEYGHALGLPDLYDRTPRPNPDSSGVGFWCLMSAGSYGGDGSSHAEEPVHLSPWCKQFLGWASVTSLEENGTYPIEPVEGHGLVYRIDLPGTDGSEYFLVEWRDRNWSDPDGRRFNWDRGLPVSGLAIWHVDERVGAAYDTWPFAPLDKGQNDAPSRPKAPKHALVALLQADRKQQLEWGDGGGDAEDFWLTGGVFGDDEKLLAGTRGYDGKVTGITLTNLDLGNTSFDLQLAPSPTAASPVAAPPAPAGRPALGQGALASSAPMAGGVAEPPSPESLHEKSEARTAVLTRASSTTTAIEREIVDLLQDTKSKKVEVQIAPEGDRVQRITGLALPAEKESVLEDAKYRIGHELRDLLGAGVDFTMKHSYRDLGWNRQIFEQVLKEGPRVLPIFNAETTLFYDRKRQLSAVVAETYPEAKVRVTGKSGEFTGDEAKLLVRKALDLDWSVLTGAREGIFLVGGEPGKGRVAFEVGVAAGEEQNDILVYVDSESHQILAVQ